jgi:hypothetical protein
MRAQICLRTIWNWNKQGFKNKSGSCREQHTHWDGRISLLETGKYFAKLFAQVEKIMDLLPGATHTLGWPHITFRNW